MSGAMQMSTAQYNYYQNCYEKLSPTSRDKCGDSVEGVIMCRRTDENNKREEYIGACISLVETKDLRASSSKVLTIRIVIRSSVVEAAKIVGIRYMW